MEPWKIAPATPTSHAGEARMWTILLSIGGAILGMALGLALGVLAKSRLQKEKGVRAGALMALAFLGQFNFVPPEATRIAEPSDEMKVKKGNKAGDPPEPDIG